MGRDWKLVALALFRLGLVGVLGTAVMVGGIALMLQGLWAGLFLVLSGAILMAIPIALYATQFLCSKLYGQSPGRRYSHDPDAPDGDAPPAIRKTSVCCTIRAWLTAEFHGVHLPLWELMSMRARGTPPDLIVDAYVMIWRQGIPATIAALEDAYIINHHRVHSAFDLVHVATGDKL